MSGRIVLVTGTDTGVGKTWVACGLVRALRAGGASVAVRKPVETGCEVAPARSEPGRSLDAADGRDVRVLAGPDLWPADAAALREAAGSNETLAAVCPYRLAEPLAPAFAARRARVAIDVRAIVDQCLRRAAGVDVLLVEGAGGLLVPLANGVTFADLARSLTAQVLLVVGARLGAINHALLTIEAVRARGLDLTGLVVDHFSPARDLATETLAESLRELSAVPFLASVGHDEDPAIGLAALARHLADAAA